MSTRDTPFTAGTPCWVDLMTDDIERSKAFYGDLFDWTFAGGLPEFGGYTTAMSGEHAVAGLMPKPEGTPMPDMWSTYIATDDINSTADKIREHGGQIMIEPMIIADIGSMAVAIDPAGAGFGLWQSGQHTGFGKYNEPGAVVWDELHSKNFHAALDFYTAVFGWTTEHLGDSDEFRYATTHVDGNVVAGVMDSSTTLPPEVPSHWTLYFSVTDADAALAKAVELGAVSLEPVEDTPFGRLVKLQDPTGAWFRLHQAPVSAS